MAYTEQQLAQALKNADAAGDEQAARRIAQEIQSMRESKPAPRTTAQEVGRQAGLTARYATEGVLALPALFAEPVAYVMNAGLRALGSDYQFPSQSAAISQGLTDIGVPEPETATERVVGDAATFIAGGGGQQQAARYASQKLGGAAQRVASELAKQPRLQITSAGTAGAATGVTRESGGSPEQQAVAGIVGGLAPAATQGAVRGAIRGGEGGRQRVVENIDAFEQSGTTPSVGQATQNRRTQAAESMLSKTPGSAGKMVEFAEQQADEVGARTREVADSLAPNSTATVAGKQIETGIEDFASRFKNDAGVLYDKVDQYLDTSSQIEMPSTLRLIDEVNPTVASAPQTSRFLRSKWFDDFKAALSEDTQAALDTTGVEGLPYQSVKEIRSMVGDKLSSYELVDDAPRAQLKRLYGALSDDLRGAAEKAGPEAAKAAKRADTFWRVGIERIEEIERVVNKNGGPEKVFKAVMSGTNEGATTLRKVMRSLDPEQRRFVASAVVRRMGLATPGQQDRLGEAFSFNTFLTNWSRLSPEARGVLFANRGKQFNQNLDALTKVAENIKKGTQVFANPSGTGQAVTLQATNAIALAAAVFNRLDAAAAILGATGGANLGARLMTNADFVRWLAQSTRSQKGIGAAQMNALAQIAKDDPAVEWAYEALQNDPGDQSNEQ